VGGLFRKLHSHATDGLQVGLCMSPANRGHACLKGWSSGHGCQEAEPFDSCLGKGINAVLMAWLTALQAPPMAD
jgi:hypothetical protein